MNPFMTNSTAQLVKQNVPNTQVCTIEDMHDRWVPGQKMALYQTGVADFQFSHHNLTVMYKLKRPPQISPPAAC